MEPNQYEGANQGYDQQNNGEVAQANAGDNGVNAGQLDIYNYPSFAQPQQQVQPIEQSQVTAQPQYYAQPQEQYSSGVGVGPDGQWGFTNQGQRDNNGRLPDDPGYAGAAEAPYGSPGKPSQNRYGSIAPLAKDSIPSADGGTGVWTDKRLSQPGQIQTNNGIGNGAYSGSPYVGRSDAAAFSGQDGSSRAGAKEGNVGRANNGQVISPDTDDYLRGMTPAGHYNAGELWGNNFLGGAVNWLATPLSNPGNWFANLKSTMMAKKALRDYTGDLKDIGQSLDKNSILKNYKPGSEKYAAGELGINKVVLEKHRKLFDEIHLRIVQAEKDKNGWNVWRRELYDKGHPLNNVKDLKKWADDVFNQRGADYKVAELNYRTALSRAPKVPVATAGKFLTGMVVNDVFDTGGAIVDSLAFQKDHGLGANDYIKGAAIPGIFAVSGKFIMSKIPQIITRNKFASFVVNPFTIKIAAVAGTCALTDSFLSRHDKVKPEFSRFLRPNGWSSVMAPIGFVLGRNPISRVGFAFLGSAGGHLIDGLIPSTDRDVDKLNKRVNDAVEKKGSEGGKSKGVVDSPIFEAIERKNPKETMAAIDFIKELDKRDRTANVGKERRLSGLLNVDMQNALMPRAGDSPAQIQESKINRMRVEYMFATGVAESRLTMGGLNINDRVPGPKSMDLSGKILNLIAIGMENANNVANQTTYKEVQQEAAAVVSRLVSGSPGGPKNLTAVLLAPHHYQNVYRQFCQTYNGREPELNSLEVTLQKSVKRRADLTSFMSSDFGPMSTAKSLRDMAFLELVQVGQKIGDGGSADNEASGVLSERVAQHMTNAYNLINNSASSDYNLKGGQKHPDIAELINIYNDLANRTKNITGQDLFIDPNGMTPAQQ